MHFIQTHTRYAKTLLLGAEVGAFGAPHNAYTIFGTAQFKHTLTRNPKTLLVVYLVHRHVLWGVTPKRQIFVHHAFQAHSYWVARNTPAGMFGAVACAFGAARQKGTLYGIVHFKHTHTRHPISLVLAYLVQPEPLP